MCIPQRAGDDSTKEIMRAAYLFKRFQERILTDNKADDENNRGNPRLLGPYTIVMDQNQSLEQIMLRESKNLEKIYEKSKRWITNTNEEGAMLLGQADTYNDVANERDIKELKESVELYKIYITSLQ